MATYRGSGKYVVIAASESEIEDILADTVHGVMFGSGTDTYIKIAERYNTSSSSISDTALSIDPGSYNDPIYIGFPNMAKFSIGGYTGYTGTLSVAYDVVISGNYEYTQYRNYTFHNGLLVGGAL